MTGFVGRLAAFASLQMLVASIVFWQGSPRDSNHYLSALQDKIERLESCIGNRILIVGGSNAAFGLNSQCIQQTTGLDTVNLGLHVSLGLPFYLETVRQHCRHGDVVVLTPEYELITTELQQGDSVTTNGSPTPRSPWGVVGRVSGPVPSQPKEPWAGAGTIHTVAYVATTLTRSGRRPPRAARR